MATDTSGGETGTGGLLDRPQLLVAVVFGAVLALVGVVSAALYGPADPVFGVFGRNYLHDGIHLLSGVAGLAAGLYAGGQFSVAYNRWIGVVYALVFVLGSAVLLAGMDEVAGIINLNMADNLLHLGLSVVFAGVGFGIGQARDAGT